ncbi:MAG: exonuclease domain-containing protein [Candidatus Gracilibacteria bacterium]
MYLFLDTETHSTTDPILIQLAYKPSDRFEYFSALYSTGGVAMDFSAMAVHHITEGEIADKPLFRDSSDAGNLQKLLKTYTLVAHNATYDIDVLVRQGIEISSSICTLRLARYLYPEIEQHKLQYLRYYLGIEFAEKPQTHDALGDVLVLEKVFYKLHETLKAQNPEKNEEELQSLMIDISSRPSVLYMCKFGKHKGTLWSEVPRDYLDWVVNKSDFTDEDVLYTARYYLEKS